MFTIADAPDGYGSTRSRRSSGTDYPTHAGWKTQSPGCLGPSLRTRRDSGPRKPEGSRGAAFFGVGRGQLQELRCLEIRLYRALPAFWLAALHERGRLSHPVHAEREVPGVLVRTEHLVPRRLHRWTGSSQKFGDHLVRT